jgi:hypothetical protein
LFVAGATAFDPNLPVATGNERPEAVTAFLFEIASPDYVIGALRAASVPLIDNLSSFYATDCSPFNIDGHLFSVSVGAGTIPVRWRNRHY